MNKRQSSRDGESCQPRRRARVLRTASRRAPPSPMTAPAMRSAWMRSSGSPSGEALWWGRSAGVGCSVSGTSGCTAYCPPVHLRASRNRPRHWCNRTRCGADCSVVGNRSWALQQLATRSSVRARGGHDEVWQPQFRPFGPPHAPTTSPDIVCAPIDAGGEHGSSVRPRSGPCNADGEVFPGGAGLRGTTRNTRDPRLTALVCAQPYFPRRP